VSIQQRETPGPGAPVIVAGAGPSGLSLAAALAALGVETTLCEAATAPGRESSRASTVHAGSLELLDALGVGKRLAESGWRASHSRVFRGRRLLVDQDWTRIESRYAFMLNLPQEDVECVLRERLGELGGSVHFGWSVAGHRQGADGATVDLERGAERRSLRARFLVGCDGAHSAVRRGLGLGLEGDTYPGLFALADVDLEGDLAPDSSYLASSARGLLGLLPLPRGRWRLNATLDRDLGEEPIDFERLAQERQLPARFAISGLGPHAVYRIHRRSSAAMRKGRVFLVGDAAHLNSPIGGQGMNRGIREAFDLAWRLARALRGEDDEDCFREWELERTAEAARVLAGTDRLTRILRAGGPAGMLGRAAVAVASRIPPAHDAVVRTLAQLADSRRILERYEATRKLHAKAT
jgi:2-polyprenyl-6-methoxyphenol hydroxylase-like FAD-dependent oxidoreductase